MRRVLLLAFAVFGALASPAAAQSPIAGGGSFNDAPVLAPGRYADTLRGGEQLFYGVALKPGQKLTAGATVAGKTDASYLMRLQIYNPLRDEDAFDGEQSQSFGQTDLKRVPAGRGPERRREGRRQLGQQVRRAGHLLHLRAGRRAWAATSRPTSSSSSSTCR